MAQAGTLRHLGLHRWQCPDTMVPLHIHLSPFNGQYLETKNFRRVALHGQTQNGRDVNLGHLRKSAHRCSYPSDTFHHRAKDDERSTKIPPGRTGSLYLQSCVRLIYMLLEQID
ncbi:hypothetical protein IG631_17658 [Alternaria alternata]|nr:hypothetical protein IG631_17658 [Alternaria alternata]